MNNKQTVFFLGLSGLASSQLYPPWTCEECEEGGAALGELASSEDAITVQVDLLLAEVCPLASDVNVCVEQLPQFWSLLAPIIMKGHFSYICDDIPECSPAPYRTEIKVTYSHTKTKKISDCQSFVPSCDDCQGRVNSVTDELALQETIDVWVNGLPGDWFCQGNQECGEFVEFLIPLALPLLSQQPRDWVDAFCEDWQCKEQIEYTDWILDKP